MTAETQDGTLSGAIEALDAGTSVYWIAYSLLDDDAYEAASRTSERMHVVGLMGLAEDVQRGYVTREDFREVLVAAAG